MPSWFSTSPKMEYFAIRTVYFQPPLVEKVHILEVFFIRCQEIHVHVSGICMAKIQIFSSPNGIPTMYMQSFNSMANLLMKRAKRVGKKHPLALLISLNTHV